MSSSSSSNRPAALGALLWIFLIIGAAGLVITMLSVAGATSIGSIIGIILLLVGIIGAVLFAYVSSYFMAAAPAKEAAVPLAPTTEAPVMEAPVAVAPAAPAPVAEPPAAAAPAAEPPVDEAPTYKAPIDEEVIVDTTTGEAVLVDDVVAEVPVAEVVAEVPVADIVAETPTGEAFVVGQIVAEVPVGEVVADIPIGDLFTEVPAATAVYVEIPNVEIPNVATPDAAIPNVATPDAAIPDAAAFSSEPASPPQAGFSSVAHTQAFHWRGVGAPGTDEWTFALASSPTVTHTYRVAAREASSSSAWHLGGGIVDIMIDNVPTGQLMVVANKKMTREDVAGGNLYRLEMEITSDGLRPATVASQVTVNGVALQ